MISFLYLCSTSLVYASFSRRNYFRFKLLSTPMTSLVQNGFPKSFWCPKFFRDLGTTIIITQHKDGLVLSIIYTQLEWYYSTFQKWPWPFEVPIPPKKFAVKLSERTLGAGNTSVLSRILSQDFGTHGIPESHELVYSESYHRANHLCSPLNCRYSLVLESVKYPRILPGI